MTNEKKYHDLLDKLADAIRNGKDYRMIERIKDKIEKAENEMYYNMIKKRKD